LKSLGAIPGTLNVLTGVDFVSCQEPVVSSHNVNILSKKNHCDVLHGKGHWLIRKIAYVLIV
jgi:hypothetical protein